MLWQWARTSAAYAGKSRYLARRCGGGTTARAGWSASRAVVVFLNSGISCVIAAHVATGSRRHRSVICIRADRGDQSGGDVG